MIGTELAYVRDQIRPLGRSAREVVAKKLRMSRRTLDRLVSGEIKFGRTDTVGKLALYFRTKEKRRA